MIEKRLLAVSLILSCGLLTAQEEDVTCCSENTSSQECEVNEFQTVPHGESFDLASYPFRYLLRFFLKKQLFQGSKQPSQTQETHHVSPIRCAPSAVQHCPCPACTGASHSCTPAQPIVHGCQCPASAGASHSCTPAQPIVHGCQCPACAGAPYYQRPIILYQQACYCHACIQANNRAAHHYVQPCACIACTQTPYQKAQPPPQHHPPPQPSQQPCPSECPPCMEDSCDASECTTYAITCPECLWETYTSVDFLYWYAKETKLVYGQKFQVVNQLLDGENDSTATFVFAPKTSLTFDTDWEPGVRLGRGWNVDGQGWDFFLSWTYFSSCVKETARIPGFSLGTIKAFPGFAQSGLLNPWINPSFSSMADDEENLPFIFNKLSATWQFRYNDIDFEIGKKFCFSTCFNLRSYTGIRAAWTKTQFQTRSFRNYSDNITGHTDVIFKDEFKNCYWGVGLLGGLEPNWYFTCNYSLFANVEASLIWGKMNLKKMERYIETQTFTGERINYKNDSNSSTFQLTPILDLAIGLRWERPWCCDSFRTELDIGWEQHIWFETNQRYKGGSPFSIQQNNSLPTLTGYGELEETSSNLMYGGLTVRFRLDF